MLGRQRASGRKGGLREGGLIKGTSEEGTGPGMDGRREEEFFYLKSNKIVKAT